MTTTTTQFHEKVKALKGTGLSTTKAVVQARKELGQPVPEPPIVPRQATLSHSANGTVEITIPGGARTAMPTYTPDCGPQDLISGTWCGVDDVVYQWTTTAGFRGQEKSFWAFPRDGVTASLADLFMCCPMQMYWKYVRGYSSRDVSLPLEFGTCGHKLLEWAYQEHDGSFPEDAGEYIADLVDRYQKLWLAQVRNPSRTQLEQQEMVYGFAECVFPNYMKRWDGDFTGGKYTYGITKSVQPVKWIEREVNFSVPYQYPDGLVVPIRGKRDGVFLDSQGREWVKDTKCLSRETDTESLPVNFQQLLYVWARMQQTGKCPKGVIYDVVKRPGHRQGKKDTTLADFFARVAADCDDPHNYEDNFARYKMDLGVGEVKEWAKNTLDPFMLDIRLWWEGKTPHYARHRNLVGKYGKAEMYHPVLTGDTSGCYQRDHVFPELGEV